MFISSSSNITHNQILKQSVFCTDRAGMEWAVLWLLRGQAAKSGLGFPGRLLGGGACALVLRGKGLHSVSSPRAPCPSAQLLSAP